MIIMRERPIIFNADMVRAVLDGRKTQTRRIIQERHLYCGGRTAGNWPVHMPEGEEGEKARLWAESNSPFGAVGDRLWVREAFRVHSRATDVATLVYKASEQQSWTQQTHRVPIEKCNKPAVIDNWTASIHMPRWASRIALEITGVRVEQLQDISQEDAKAEGCWRGRGFGTPDLAVTPIDEFPSLWASIYGADSWKANPWVWVIEFKRVEVE